MSIEILRDLARQFTAAADGIEQAASLGNAVNERGLALARLDVQLADARSELSDLRSKAAETAASIAAVNEEFARTEKARREALDAELEQRKQAADKEFAEIQVAREEKLSALANSLAQIAAEVDALTSQRDALVAEMKAAKQRIASL